MPDDMADGSNKHLASSTYARIMFHHCRLRLTCPPMQTPRAATKETSHLDGSTLHMLPPRSFLLDSSSLLRLRLRLTRLLQRSEAFSFDSLALLLLIGAYDVSFLERGL